MLATLRNFSAPVAQLDRVLPSEGRGRGFESRLVHHLLSLAQGNRFTPPLLLTLPHVIA